MRLSLVTRVFAGFFLVFCLLSGVAVYAIASMIRMQSEVTLVKQGLLPVSARLATLNRELAQMAALLTNSQCEEVLWLRHALPEFEPFPRLEEVVVRLEELAAEDYLSDQSRQLFATVAADGLAVVRGNALFARQVQELAAAGVEVEGRSNRAFYASLTERFLFLTAATPADAVDPLLERMRDTLAASLGLLSRHVREMEAQANLAINSAWGNAREREERAVTISFYLGILALAVTLAVLILLVVWLRPLRTLRTVAQRISTGDYDHPAPTGRGDEIGALSDELNKMATRLKEREEMIRKQSGELLRADRFSTIGKMSTQIAHEIRNPLNALGLKLELLEESVAEVQDRLSPETFEELRRAAEAGGKEIDRLREITEYYLKFAKFPKVEKETVDLHTVLSDVVAFYEEEARRKGIVIEKELERPLRARADSNLLRHALANLLKNAIEAISGDDPERSGRIVVGAQRDGPRIRVTVRDNGPGIPPDEVDRVFEPFYSTKRSGTGLGLTLVQQVVTEHGGTIHCTSTPGEGTMFKLAIPE